MVIASVTVYSHPPGVVNVNFIDPESTIVVAVVVVAEAKVAVEVEVVEPDRISHS
jgi:hypothetical protein